MNNEKEIIVNLDKVEFIPSEPYLSEVISAQENNLWELNELHPDNQEIKIIIKS